MVLLCFSASEWFANRGLRESGFQRLRNPAGVDRLVVRGPDIVSSSKRHFSMARVTWGEMPSYIEASACQRVGRMDVSARPLK